MQLTTALSAVNAAFFRFQKKMADALKYYFTLVHYKVSVCTVQIKAAQLYCLPLCCSALCVKEVIYVNLCHKSYLKREDYLLTFYVHYISTLFYIPCSKLQPCLRTDIKKVLLQVDSNGYFPDDDDASTHLEKCRQEKHYFTYLRLM